MFQEKYQHHKINYLENSHKYGNHKQIPCMVANDENKPDDFDGEYSQPGFDSYHYHVGSKRPGGFTDVKTKGFSTRARMENSLDELTRKFIMLIRDSKDNMSVDLNEAAI